ncbi:MAG: protein-L-isoaspartate O-methyltransferase [Burkholderiaceae bacterium]|nr:MAG: protein-L-isoaspartate O-methyltransferase [Burkholderiaceae bacterium]
MNLEQARFNMIEQQIRPWNVLDVSILSLLSAVRREDFVPAQHQSLAFVDMEIPLEGGRKLLAPRVEARIVQELQVHKHERVLLVGAATGYLAALLGHKAQRVLAFEADDALAQQARANLQRAGLGNVEVRVGTGADGAPQDAPFDVIVLAGAIDEVPAAILQQLKQGGRLLAITGQEPVQVARIHGADQSARPVFDTVVAPLPGFKKKSGFSF